MCVVIIIMDKQSIKITNDFMISCYIHLCSACIRPLNKESIELRELSRICTLYIAYRQ